MQPKELKIGIFLIRQEDISPTDFNQNRWFLYKSGRLYGRYKTEKKAIMATKS